MKVPEIMKCKQSLPRPVCLLCLEPKDFALKLPNSSTGILLLSLLLCNKLDLDWSRAQV